MSADLGATGCSMPVKEQEQTKTHTTQLVLTQHQPSEHTAAQQDSKQPQKQGVAVVSADWMSLSSKQSNRKSRHQHTPCELHDVNIGGMTHPGWTSKQARLVGSIGMQVESPGVFLLAC